VSECQRLRVYESINAKATKGFSMSRRWSLEEKGGMGSDKTEVQKCESSEEEKKVWDILRMGC
jgi:hypothetical protein